MNENLKTNIVSSGKSKTSYRTEKVMRTAQKNVAFCKEDSYSTLLESYNFGDIQVQYRMDRVTGNVGLNMVPLALVDKVVGSRDNLDGNPELVSFPESVRAANVDSLVQIKCLGDGYPGGFAQGRSMRNSETTLALKYEGQEFKEDNEKSEVITRLVHDRFVCFHILRWFYSEQAVRVHTIIENSSSSPLTIEMLSSFSLEGITPFERADAPNCLVLHRIRSSWSSEGRLESCPVEDYQLERSWNGHAAVSERFGQVGSMPVRNFFPFIAVEDTKRKVIWAAQLGCACSWQIEAYRKDDSLCISGGLADREFGHWYKSVEPNEKFVTPEATLTVAKSDIDDVSQRLTSCHKRPLLNLPAAEDELPIIFNNWCTSWGQCSQDEIYRIADLIKGTEIKYFVIDAGWYLEDGKDWGESQGNWIPNKDFFPAGLKKAADTLRKKGFVPGLWFEMEVVGSLIDDPTLEKHLLKRDGHVIYSGKRRFWDFRDKFVITYLKEKVIKLLKDCGFGYIKIDYNDSLGIGVDGSESPGEGLRRHIEGVKGFITAIKSEIPGIVIEICSSGGHRLEPSMMALSSMGSFSDAHETTDIPIIAANLHRVILPRQSQIWSVLRKTDNLKRLTYSLAATFLGRMCISGDVDQLSDVQQVKLLQAQKFYRKIHHIIKDGISHRYGPKVNSYRYPEGWQAVLRQSHNNREGLLIIHSFDSAAGQKIKIDLGSGQWDVADAFFTDDFDISIDQQFFECTLPEDFDACAVYLKKL